MKKKEYISPVMTAVALKAKHRLLVGSDSKIYRKVSIKNTPGIDHQQEIDEEDDGGELD